MDFNPAFIYKKSFLTVHYSAKMWKSKIKDVIKDGKFLNEKKAAGVIIRSLGRNGRK